MLRHTARARHTPRRDVERSAEDERDREAGDSEDHHEGDGPVGQAKPRQKEIGGVRGDERRGRVHDGDVVHTPALEFGEELRKSRHDLDACYEGLARATLVKHATARSRRQ
jgi:hypothetical protein